MTDYAIRVEPYVPESELEEVACDVAVCDGRSRWLLGPSAGVELLVDALDLRELAGAVMLDLCDAHLIDALAKLHARAAADQSGHPSALDPKEATDGE